MKKVILILIFAAISAALIVAYSETGSDFSIMHSKTGTYFLENNRADQNIPNAVTSIVTIYRGYDTVGEVTVLFLAVLGVMMIASSLGLGRMESSLDAPGFVLQHAAIVLFPLIVLFGAYIIINGHLSPGGGFQGGAVIGSGMLMLFLSGKRKELNMDATHAVESLSVILILIIGLMGIYYVNSFLANFMNTGSVYASVLSGGLIPIIYILVGIKVTVEFFHLAEYLLRS